MAFDGTITSPDTTGSYVLSFAGGIFAHISDGTSVGQTYNWHDGLLRQCRRRGALAPSRVDGLAFIDLVGFDYTLRRRPATVSAAGFTPSGTLTRAPGKRRRPPVTASTNYGWC